MHTVNQGMVAQHGNRHYCFALLDKIFSPCNPGIAVCGDWHGLDKGSVRNPRQRGYENFVMDVGLFLYCAALPCCLLLLFRIWQEVRKRHIAAEGTIAIGPVIQCYGMGGSAAVKFYYFSFQDSLPEFRNGICRFRHTVTKGEKKR